MGSGPNPAREASVHGAIVYRLSRLTVSINSRRHLMLGEDFGASSFRDPLDSGLGLSRRSSLSMTEGHQWR